MLADQVTEVISEVVASHEFRDMVLRVAMAKFGPKLAEVADESVKETIVDNNLTPDGLAWNFQQKLTRRPNSQEDIVSISAYMADMIQGGISGERILEVLKTRGRHVETIWDFLKRVRAATPVKTNDAIARAQELQRQIREREGS